MFIFHYFSLFLSFLPVNTQCFNHTKFKPNSYNFCQNLNPHSNTLYPITLHSNTLHTNSFQFHPVNSVNVGLNTAKTGERGVNVWSLGSYLGFEDPLIFTQCLEPGKEAEITVSESQTHGINKVIHDVTRRNNTNQPLFPVGTRVYVHFGPFKTIRGTVLFNRFTQIAKPYQVLVSLDCRDSDGLLRSNVARYHGKSHWIPEHFLTRDNRVPFPNHTPSHTNHFHEPKSSSRVGRLEMCDIYIMEISSSYNLSRIFSLYNEARVNNFLCNTTEIRVFEQIVRVFNLMDDKNIEIIKLNQKNSPKDIDHSRQPFLNFDDKRIFLNLTLTILNKLNTSQYSSLDYLSLMWSSAKLISLKFVDTNFDAIFTFSERKITPEDIKHFSAQQITKLLTAYSVIKRKHQLHLFQISNIVTNTPVTQLYPQMLKLLLMAYDNGGLDTGSLVPFVNEFVAAREHDIPKSMASIMIRCLNHNLDQLKNTIDKLYSIVLSHEGDHGNFVEKDFYRALECCILRDEMFEKFEKLFYSSNLTLKPYTINLSLLKLKHTPHTKLKIFLTQMALDTIDGFSNSRLLFLLRHVDSSLPKDLLMKLYNVFKSKLRDITGIKNFFTVLNYIDTHSLPLHNDIKQILGKMNGLVFQYGIFPIFYSVELLARISKNYEIDVYKEAPRFIENLLSLISSDSIFLPNAIGNFVYLLSEIAPTLFQQSAHLATTQTTQSPESTDTTDSTEFTDTTDSTVETVAVESGEVNLGFEYPSYVQDTIQNNAMVILSKILKVMKERLSKSFFTPFFFYLGEPNSTAANRKMPLSPNQLKWPLLFLYLTVKGGMIDEMSFPREKLLNYLNAIKDELTNDDLNLLKRTLDMLKLDSQDFDQIIQSIPKGIDTITNS